MRTEPRVGVASAVATLSLFLTAPVGAFEAGAAKRDLTPPMDRPVFLAGFGHNRTAVGVHDPVWARCLALSDGTNTVA